MRQFLLMRATVLRCLTCVQELAPLQARPDASNRTPAAGNPRTARVSSHACARPFQSSVATQFSHVDPRRAPGGTRCTRCCVLSFVLSAAAFRLMLTAVTLHRPCLTARLEARRQGTPSTCRRTMCERGQAGRHGTGRAARATCASWPRPWPRRTTGCQSFRSRIPWQGAHTTCSNTLVPCTAPAAPAAARLAI